MQDPFTGLPTLLTGRRLPGQEERLRLQHDHRGRLEALARLSALAAECGVATDPDRDLVTLPEDALSLLELGDPLWGSLGAAIRAWRKWVPLLRLEDFGFPADAENPLEEPNLALRRIGGGVEAWAFAEQALNTVYKFYLPIAGEAKQVGSAFEFRPGDESSYEAVARPGNYRELLEKLMLIEALGGMPTEIVAVTPEGVLVAKQALGDTLPQGEDMSLFLPQDLIEVPSRFLRANRDHPRLFFLEGVPHLVADLHARNFVRASDGRLRVIDLVAARWPDEALESPLVADWMRRVRSDPDASPLPPSRDEDL
jgi:hypothetical protein